MADTANFQDWEPRVLTKSSKGKGPAPRTQSRTLTDDYDPESITPVATSNRSMGLAIQQGRMEKGLKQAELDQRCNFARGTTSSYESGKAIYRPGEVNKMARVLGITVPRPTKTKTGSKGKK
jgi:ribosome-binding protein aMBF1 (putative translation factor)